MRKGESQRRSDGRYVYTYTDPIGRRKYVYAQDLVTLREKEAQLMKDQMDGLDIYVAGKATVNFVFLCYFLCFLYIFTCISHTRHLLFCMKAANLFFID